MDKMFLLCVHAHELQHVMDKMFLLCVHAHELQHVMERLEPNSRYHCRKDNLLLMIRRVKQQLVSGVHGLEIDDVNADFILYLINYADMLFTAATGNGL
jgi:hypothetical protein